MCWGSRSSRSPRHRRHIFVRAAISYRTSTTSAKVTLVNADGQREDFKLTHEQAVAFAKLAAKEFGIGESQSANFDSDLARKDIAGEGDVKKTRKASAKAAAEAKAE